MTTCPVEESALRTVERATPEEIRSATYAEFLYGYGASRGVDLGLPLQFSRLAPGVFQQRFDHGRTIANVGDRPVRIELPALHADLEGRVLTVAVIAPRSAEVLRAI
jgi:hypothetical protein